MIWTRMSWYCFLWELHGDRLSDCGMRGETYLLKQLFTRLDGFTFKYMLLSVVDE